DLGAGNHPLAAARLITVRDPLPCGAFVMEAAAGILFDSDEHLAVVARETVEGETEEGRPRRSESERKARQEGRSRPSRSRGASGPRSEEPAEGGHEIRDCSHALLPSHTPSVRLSYSLSRPSGDTAETGSRYRRRSLDSKVLSRADREAEPLGAGRDVPVAALRSMPYKCRARPGQTPNRVGGPGPESGRQRSSLAHHERNIMRKL